jgi:HAD superfamily hydrolase (TIGR01662 family)
VTLKAVLFDLGNTLWHIPEPPPVQKVREETMRRIFALLGSWGIEPGGELHFLGRDIRMVIGAADRTAYEGDCVSPDFPTLVGEVAAGKGLDLTPEQSEQLWAAWNLGGPFFGRRLFSDAIETLSTLHDRGYHLGCVTNRSFCGPAFMEEIEENGLGGLLDTIAISCDVGYLKPHPRIYQHALETIDVEPEEAVMVGDSLRADIAGAQALGMTAVWCRRPGIVEDVDGVRPDFVVDELRDLPQLSCFRPEIPNPGTSAR